MPDATIDPAEFEQKMWEAVDSLAAAQAALDAAEAHLLEQREAANAAMTNYHAALDQGDRRVPSAVIRKLYWENPALFVTPIATAFAIKGGANQVPVIAGPSPEGFPCPGGCGPTVHLTARKAKLNPCPACQAEANRRRAEENTRASEQREIERKQRDERLRDEFRSGKSPEEVYVERTAPYDGEGRVIEHLKRLADEVALEGNPNVF